LSSSAGGEGEVARAEGEAEVALGSSALARAGEEKDADAGAAAAFSSSSSAAMGAEETMSAWGGGLGGLLRFRSALVLLAWLRLFIFLLPELRCAGGGAVLLVLFGDGKGRRRRRRGRILGGRGVTVGDVLHLESLMAGPV